MKNKQEFKVMFGKYVRKKRSEKSLTIEELAWKVGINPNHLGRIERGEKGTSGFVLLKIVFALELALDIFFNDFRPL